LESLIVLFDLSSSDSDVDTLSELGALKTEDEPFEGSVDLFG
jgi:hypothetical protein